MSLNGCVLFTCVIRGSSSLPNWSTRGAEGVGAPLSSPLGCVTGAVVVTGCSTAGVVGVSVCFLNPAGTGIRGWPSGPTGI